MTWLLAFYMLNITQLSFFFGYKWNTIEIQGGCRFSNIKSLSWVGYFLFYSFLGIGLQDSPVALAGYILERFSTGTNKDYINAPDGGLTE